MSKNHLMKHSVKNHSSLAQVKKKEVQIYKDNKLEYIAVRKELNSFARYTIIGIYSLIIFSLGIKLSSNHLQESMDQKFTEIQKLIADNQKNALEEDLNRGPASIDESLKLVRSNNKVLSGMISTELKNLLDKRVTNEQQIIEKQREENRLLKEKLNTFLVAQSTKESSNSFISKTIPFSEKNMDILYYEQELKLKSFKKNQELEREAFLLTHPLEDSDNIQKWENFQNRQKLEYYSMKKTYQEERRNFRDKKFRIASNNSF